MRQYSTKINSVRAEQIKSEWFNGAKPVLLDDRITINRNMKSVVIRLSEKSFISAEIGDWIIVNNEGAISSVSDSAFQLLFELKQDKALIPCAFEEKGEYCFICDRGSSSVGKYVLISGTVEVVVEGIERVYKTIDNYWLFKGKNVIVYALEGDIRVPSHWMKIFGQDRPLPIPMLWTGYCPEYDKYLIFSENPGKVLSEGLLSKNMRSEL